jgi:hypothetical protein
VTRLQERSGVLAISHEHIHRYAYQDKLDSGNLSYAHAYPEQYSLEFRIT